MKKLFFLAAAATIALSSCVKNDTVYTDAQTPMEFKAFNVASTKAPIEGTTFDQNISVFAVYNNTGKAYFPETTFEKKEASRWGGNPARYWPTTGVMDFAAYSPADAGDATPTYAEGGSISKISVVCPDNNAADQKDIIYGDLLNDIVCPQTNPVGMLFHHALAQIVLKFKQGQAAAADTYQITVKKVTLNNLVLGGTLDITPAATSAINWSSKNAAVAYEVDATNHVLTTEYDGTVLKGVLVVPSDQTSVTIVYDITIGGNTNEVEQIVNLNTSTTTEADKWEAGKKYTYNLNINLKEIEFKPEVEPWVDAPEKDITIE